MRDDERYLLGTCIHHSIKENVYARVEVPTTVES